MIMEEFLESMRKINNPFSFASFGASEEKSGTYNPYVSSVAPNESKEKALLIFLACFLKTLP